MSGNEYTIVTFDEWLAVLKKQLPILGYAKILAFGASCCERALPNYLIFSAAEHWGNPRVLRESMELIWRFVAAGNPTEAESYSRLLVEALDRATPDTEQFKSPLTSAALDAVNSLAEALEYARDSIVDHILVISSVSRDTIDMFVQRRDNLAPSDRESEARIARDPLMIAELEKQQLDIQKLQSTQNLHTEFWSLFRQATTRGGRSNLGLCA